MAQIEAVARDAGRSPGAGLCVRVRIFCVCNAPATHAVCRRHVARGTGSVSPLSVREYVEAGAAWHATARRWGTRLQPAAAWRFPDSAAIIVPREKSGGADLGQLHLTTLSPGGSRAQQAV